MVYAVIAGYVQAAVLLALCYGARPLENNLKRRPEPSKLLAIGFHFCRPGLSPLPALGSRLRAVSNNRICKSLSAKMVGRPPPNEARVIASDCDP